MPAATKTHTPRTPRTPRTKVAHTRETVLSTLTARLKDARGELAAINKEGVTRGSRLASAIAKVDAYHTAVRLVKLIPSATPFVSVQTSTTPPANTNGA